MESDLAWASTLTLTGVTAEVVDRINALFNPRCRLEVAIGGGIYPAIEDTSVTNILGHADLQASRPHPASLIRRDR